ncbi:Hypothetical predicted protein [Paramuricea clavata]|uniref:Uncharacterized protein n=1 Tax=Paramuricea clavata TaxID=317549 RepID=A0A6S7KG20_PARCT|nr:Hypothetical predicted protein [Paramuricea clavata]
MATSNSLPPPRPLSFEGNLAENWRWGIQQFRLYLSATRNDKKDEKVQCSILLTVAGEDAVEVLNTFTFTETEEDKIELLIAKFRGYCTPKKNITFERHVFNTRCQESDESIDTALYTTIYNDIQRYRVEKTCKLCEFGDLQDSQVRDGIVCGIKSAEGKTAARSSAGYVDPGYEDHELCNCPANGQTCHECQGRNHFARVCRSSGKPAHVVEESSDSEKEMYIVTVTKKKNSKNGWNQECRR